MLVRTLVIGGAQLVRSVGDELLLRVDGCVECPHGLLECVEHRVEAAGEVADLDFADWRDAPAPGPGCG